MSLPDRANADHAAMLARLSQVALSDADLRANEAELATPLESAGGARVTLLCFRAAGERFALPASCVERVFAPQPARRVPHRRHAAFRGLVAHEGELLPLGSIERLLDLPPSSAPTNGTARMLAIGPAGRAWAFEAQSVDGVVSVPEGDLRAAPVTVAKGLGSATRLLARLPDGEEAAVLDPDSLCAGWEAASR
jgi:chemotaxis-related protein WspD